MGREGKAPRILKDKATLRRVIGFALRQSKNSSVLRGVKYFLAL
jgi:hypothetical protein